MKPRDVTPEEVFRAIAGTKGIIVNLERKLGCTRQAIKDIIAQYPAIKKEMDDEAEREKDIVLNNLIEDAKAGDKFARELYLKSQARDRGFGDKVEVSNSGQPMVFLHAVANDLIPNARNNNATKASRIDSWASKALDYHETQTAEVNEKGIEALLDNKKA